MLMITTIILIITYNPKVLKTSQRSPFHISYDQIPIIHVLICKSLFLLCKYL